MSPFLSDCPSLLLGIAIHCIQHSQAMLERGVCELAHSFFSLTLLLSCSVLYFICGGLLFSCGGLFQGEGCALIGRLNKFEQIIRGMRSVLDVPLTVKMRTGIFDNKNIAHTVIPRLRDWGVSMVTVSSTQ